MLRLGAVVRMLQTLEFGRTWYFYGFWVLVASFVVGVRVSSFTLISKYVFLYLAVPRLVMFCPKPEILNPGQALHHLVAELLHFKFFGIR